MKKIYLSICALSMAVPIFGIGSLAAQAAPFPVAEQVVTGDLHEAQYRRDDRRYRVERRRYDRDRIERRRVVRPRFERRGNTVYLNRHRGYREYRRGYRRYNGWWFPPAAFIGGAIIGGAIANQPTVVVPGTAVRLSAAHVRWCQNRWRSYRVSDNTYQPYNGPRRYCVSPYSR